MRRRRRGDRLRGVIESPWFTWVAGGVGIIAFWALRTLPSVREKTPDEILETPTPAFISIALVVALWLLKLIVLDARKRFRRRPRDLVYRRVEYVWRYRALGDLEGNCFFDVENRTRAAIDRLPVEGLIWFKPILRKTFRFHIHFRDGDRLHHFAEDEPSIAELPRIVDVLRRRTGFHLTWSPRLLPPLAPGESILYEVELATPGTEIEAFAQQGSAVGFPVTRFVDQVSLIAFSPIGYRFVLLEPAITVCRLDQPVSEPALEAAVDAVDLSDGGSRLEWVVSYPVVGHRYSIHYKFETRPEYGPAAG